MPNWVECDLKIRSKEVQKIVDEISAPWEDCGTKGIGISFNKIKPMPEELRGTTAPSEDNEKSKELKAKYGCSDWYDWSLANWGTKWDANHFGNWSVEGDVAFCSFSTAWSPPEAVLLHLSKLYPQARISLRYYEGSMEFAGSTTYKGGEVIAQSYRENYRGGRGG